MNTLCHSETNISNQDADKQNSRTITSQIDKNSGLKCIGILPGLGTYEDSSDSDCSSDTDQETEPNPIKYDMLGRAAKILKNIEKEKS